MTKRGELHSIGNGSSPTDSNFVFPYFSFLFLCLGHSLLKKQGFDFSSYGMGDHIKLPGPSLREPNVYECGTSYKHMISDLRHKDLKLYKRNGILLMLKRNLSVKLAPQRWQDNVVDGFFDIVFSFEEKVFDMVIEDLHNRDQLFLKSVLMINLEVKDNHAKAAV
ncbi:hypothetical protein REPUB_Repub11eG0087900 [Reevesia pubescens]